MDIRRVVNQLNGWQRLWIAYCLITLIGICALSIYYVGAYFNADAKYFQAHKYKIIKAAVKPSKVSEELKVYTVQDSKTGKKVTFLWYELYPPDDRDMDRIFKEAKKLPLENITPLSEPLKNVPAKNRLRTVAKKSLLFSMKLILFWTLICVLVYFAGIVINWIVKGFRSPPK